MSRSSALNARVRRGAQVGGAFVRIDFIDATNYPLAIVMKALSAAVPVVTFAFVAKLIDQNGADVAFDYYTFVVIGIIAMNVLGASLNSFGSHMLEITTQGQLEMFLVEPIRWRALPFVMIAWPGFVAAVTASIMITLSVGLGASYRVSTIPTALAVTVLGLAATLAIGILGASIKVLAKRADPVLALYTIAASVLSGAFYPVELLPSFLRSLSWLIPHTYVIQALRRVLMEQGATLPGPTSGQAILALLGFCLVAYPISLWVFGRTLEYGRKIGALSGY